MADDTSNLSAWGKFWDRVKRLGWLQTTGHYLRRLGIRFILFYYIKEQLPAFVPAKLTTLPEGFELSVFTRDDVMAISALPERNEYVGSDYVIHHFNAGDTCIGIKHKGEMAAFAWFSTIQSRDEHYQPMMKANEAYLYDMYVLRKFRGNNLSPILRYLNYLVLKDMGRDTFYSVTESFNKGSLRFKQKLGSATFVFKGFYVDLFGKFRKMWILKRY